MTKAWKPSYALALTVAPPRGFYAAYWTNWPNEFVLSAKRIQTPKPKKKRQWRCEFEAMKDRPRKAAQKPD